jgi:hypothetical protein
MEQSTMSTLSFYDHDLDSWFTYRLPRGWTCGPVTEPKAPTRDLKAGVAFVDPMHEVKRAAAELGNQAALAQAEALKRAMSPSFEKREVAPLPIRPQHPSIDVAMAATSESVTVKRLAPGWDRVTYEPSGISCVVRREQPSETTPPMPFSDEWIEAKARTFIQFTTRRVSSASDFVSRVRGSVSMFSKAGFSFIAGAIFCLWGPTLLQRIPTPAPMQTQAHSAVMLTSHDAYTPPPAWTDVTIVGPCENVFAETYDYKTGERMERKAQRIDPRATFQIVETDDGRRFRVEGTWGDLGDECKLPTAELVTTQRTGIASWFAQSP